MEELSYIYTVPVTLPSSYIGNTGTLSDAVLITYCTAGSSNITVTICSIFVLQNIITFFILIHFYGATTKTAIACEYFETHNIQRLVRGLLDFKTWPQLLMNQYEEIYIFIFEL